MKNKLIEGIEMKRFLIITCMFLSIQGSGCVLLAAGIVEATKKPSSAPEQAGAASTLFNGENDTIQYAVKCHPSISECWVEANKQCINGFKEIARAPYSGGFDVMVKCN